MIDDNIHHLDQVPMQDLTPELVRSWLDSACIDVALDDEGDLLLSVDGTRIWGRIDRQRGVLFLSCSIRLDTGLGVDHEAWLDAVNAINRSTMFVRAVLRDEDGIAPCVHYEHELFGLDGVVTRRQLVKLVRTMRNTAWDRHEQLHEAAA